MTMGMVAALHFAASSDMRGTKETATQILVAAGLCVLLTDAFFLKVTTIPFTEARVPLNTDLAFVLLRYIVVFPTLVFTTANIEPWIEASAGHLFITAILILAAHIAMRYQHGQIIARPTNQNGFDEEPAPFLTLGLRR
jgi:small-conductance mechanosensitive channel